MKDTAAAPAPPGPWLISPAADLCLLVATPLAIVPAAAMAVRYFSPEQIFLMVAAFASIGHHLPGFLRCYGDRELFLRFRWRFLLAPPAALAAALAFSSLGLHGLELVLLLWATWHIMMQTYGFMRIYDLKRGRRDALSARLDFLLCGAVFAAGIAFSEARVYGIAEIALRIGLPLPSPEWLTAIRWLVGVAAGVIAAGFLANALRHGAAGLHPLKLLLVLATAWLYWVCGSVTTNLLIGVAMFEVFHALQYYAIVWTYNRRLADRVGERFGPLGFLFRDRWLFLPIYIAAIAAFGSMKLVSEGVHHPLTQQVLLAVLAASTILHFYYDGFIWKVSERRTQRNLGITGEGKKSPAAGGVSHGLKWAAAFTVGGLLLAWERSGAGGVPRDEQRIVAALAAWTPQLPELQTRLSQHALARGDMQTALSAARRAVAVRPRSHEAQAALGVALLHAKQFPQAAAHLQQATELAPHLWQNYHDLALALAHMEQWQAAERAFARAAELEPDGAAEYLAAAQLRLGQAFFAQEKWPQAAACFASALERQPQSAEAHFQLGMAYVQLENYPRAERMFQKAVLLQPEHGPAHFQLGNVHYYSRQLELAEQSYRRCLEILPDSADAHNNLGSVLLERDDLEGAAAAYRGGLSLRPENGAGHYNLGLVLIRQNKLTQARRHIQSAAAAGIAPSPEVAQLLGFSDGAPPP